MVILQKLETSMHFTFSLHLKDKNVDKYYYTDCLKVSFYLIPPFNVEFISSIVFFYIFLL